MAKNPQIFVEYIAKTEQLARASADVEKSGGRIKSAFGGVKGAIAAGLATGAVVSFGKSCITAAQDSEVATRRLENVFKSMGDTTGQAAKAAEAYAGTLSKKIGVDDEAIMSAQALLATFKNVSNETGRQAGIFDRATNAAADLAAAGFGSLDTNAKQLGKALQDPVKGLTALGRAGVTFTDSEKERIKTLVESNQLTEAQKVLLQAVETQVKGTAEATATGSQKAKVAFGELEESIGKALLPALQAITPILTSIFNAVGPLMPILGPLALAIGAIVVGVKAWAIAQAALNFVLTANPIGIIVVALAGLVLAIVLIIKHWRTLAAAFNAGFDAIKQAGRGLLSFFQGLVGTLESIVRGAVNVIKSMLNFLIRSWNRIGFKIPAFHIKLKFLPDIDFPGFQIHVPQIPELAAGGVVSKPTLAMVGEGRGREIVAPESLLRQIMGEQAVHVRVFLGDQELRGMVRTEITDANTGLARTLLSGGRA